MYYEVWICGTMVLMTSEQLLRQVHRDGEAMAKTARCFTECNDADEAAKLLESHELASVNKVG